MMKKLLLPMIIFIVSIIFIPNVAAAEMVQNPNIISCVTPSGKKCEFGGYNSPLSIEIGSEINYHLNDRQQRKFLVLNDNKRVLTLILNHTAVKSKRSGIEEKLNSNDALEWSNVKDLSSSYKAFTSNTSIKFNRTRLMSEDEINNFMSICRDSSSVNSTISCKNSQEAKYYWINGSDSNLKYLTQIGTVNTPQQDDIEAINVQVVEVFRYVDTSSIGTNSSNPSSSSSDQNENKVENSTNNFDSNSEKEKTGSQTVKVDNTSKEVYLPYIIGSFIVIGGVIFITYAYKKIEKENTD